MSIIDVGSAPAYLQIATKAARLRELGMSDRVIARAIGVSDKTVAKSLRRAQAEHQDPDGTPTADQPITDSRD